MLPYQAITFHTLKPRVSFFIHSSAQRKTIVKHNESNIIKGDCNQRFFNIKVVVYTSLNIFFER